MALWILINIGSDNGLLSDLTKLLQISVKLKSKYKTLFPENAIAEGHCEILLEGPTYSQIWTVLSISMDEPAKIFICGSWKLIWCGPWALDKNVYL